MKKTRGQKSHASVPLSTAFELVNFTSGKILILKMTPPVKKSKNVCRITLQVSVMRFLISSFFFFIKQLLLVPLELGSLQWFLFLHFWEFFGKKANISGTGNLVIRDIREAVFVRLFIVHMWFMFWIVFSIDSFSTLPCQFKS